MQQEYFKVLFFPRFQHKEQESFYISKKKWSCFYHVPGGIFPIETVYAPF